MRTVRVHLHWRRVACAVPRVSRKDQPAPMRTSYQKGTHALWWVSLAFVLGGFWSEFSFYFGLTLFFVYLFRSRL